MSVKKIDSLVLKNETIDSMKDILYSSKKDKIEYGADLCRVLVPEKWEVSNELHLENVCKGEACRIKLERKCKGTSKLSGDYHTHTHPEAAIPSILDIDGSVTDKLNVMCIGNTEVERIMCYVVKKQIPFSAFLREAEKDIHKALVHLLSVSSVDPKRKIFDSEHHRVVGDILNKYYNIHRIYDKSERNPKCLRRNA